MFDSQRIRRQIGIQKKKLARHIEAFKQILRDNNISEKEVAFQQFSDEEITEFQEEIIDARNQLLKAYSLIEQLHTEWSSAQEADPNERLVFTQYLEKYGDYTKTIQEAVSTLENSDELLNHLDTEFAKRHLPIQMTQPHNYEGTPEQLLHAQQLSSNQQRQETTSTTNFVDASILSRLDLPSFDGNLLEYPEFFARYSTLIGDKKELDDTTKFSLLKSCLRGRALHSIQGLALTATNYRIALDILKTRFDDKVTTRHILFSQLANLPPCDPEGKNLQSLYNKMFALTRQFCSYEDDSKEIALGAILINKLPRHIRSRIYDATGNSHNLTPTELLHILTSIVQKEATLQEIEFHCKSFQHPHEDGYASLHRSQKKNVRENPRFRREPTQARRLQPINSTSNKLRCAFCESNQHSTFYCTKFPTPQLRAQITRDKKLCFNCLSSKHRTKECPSKRFCRTCARRHHTTLCFQTSAQQQDQRKYRHDAMQAAPSNVKHKEVRNQQVHFVSSAVPSTTQQEDNANVSEVTASTNSSDVLLTPPSTPVLLMCTEVEVFNPNNPDQVVKTTAFLDSGSSRSYITTDLADKLALPIEETEELSMFTFGTVKPLSLSATHHAIGLQTLKGAQILFVKAIQHLTNDLKIVTFTEELERMATFAAESRKPSILIGADYFWNIILSDDFYVKNLPNGYQIVHSSIGDIVTGKPLRTGKAANYCYISTTEEHENLDNLLQRFFDLEAQGTVDNHMTTDDETCMRKFNETIFFDESEGRYIVQFPFKGNKEELPSNLQLAYARLVQNIKILRQKPALLEEYHRLIQDQLARRIIEEVDEVMPPSCCHYLAHHAVISKSSTTTKVRCVYDGSAKTKDNPSLNDLLFRGPVLLPDITGLILRIRTTPIIISSDIEKAFLMIGLDEESKNFTRFLWLKDPQKSVSPENITTYRFRRVPFGLIVSPFLLAGTIRHHLIMTETPLAQELIRNTYVDNIYYGVDSIDQGKDFYNESKQLFLKAGMNLRQYISNSSELNNFFATKEGTKVDENHKILGISWNVKSDQFTIKLPTLPDPDITWTKRQVLKMVAKMYDPLGWCAPVLFSSKQFLQSLWKEKLGWDEALPPHHVKVWKEITSSWSTTNITIARKLLRGTKSTSTFEIHVFTDASKAGYCAVAYLVEIHETRSSSILMSKTRLAPLKSILTIPRLELSAINLGSLLLKHIIANLDIPIERTFIWSDSNVALMWIKSRTTLPVFIRNRINSIRINAPDAILRFTPGNSNPADIGSRGVSIGQLVSDDTWWKGPHFLTKTEDQWPADISSEQNQVYCHVDEIHTDPPPTNTLLQPERFSSWLRLLRVVYTILLFFVKKSNKAKQHFGGSKSELHEKAEVILFRRAQMDFPPSSAIKEQLNLYFCEETKLWKSRGRVENADLPKEAISPVYLPRESHITSLYVLHVHLTNNHCGVNHILTELRQKVWITKGRHTIKRVLNKLCYHCKRYTAQPFKLPEFPQHPAKRVRRPKYPFESVGMDYAGPLLCKSDENIPAKYWIILLTCLNTRAIYVDLVPDMSAKKLLHTLRRFFATVAYPKWILCDNSQTFKSIADLQTPFTTEEERNLDIIDYCAQRKIEFKFIPSFSPWQGGLYEKMVHIFKVSYKHALNNRLLRMEELQTIAKESEAVVNSRPLTYISEENCVPPLRPIDFLRPGTVLSVPRQSEPETEWKPTTTTRDLLIEGWNATNNILNRFWNRWSAEYLTSLREQYRRNHPHPRCTNESLPKKDDIVLIQDKNLERGQWQIGQIISSSDNYQRSANVKLPSKRIITRPINLLCKMEIRDTKETTSEEASPPTPPRGHPMMTRSKTLAKNPGTLLSLAMVITLCSTTIHASTRCPSELNIPKKIIYATSCVNQGVAIATYQSNEGTKICWFPISCPTGHIRVSIPLLQNQALCGSECTCPSWATSCSFSTTSKKNFSLLSNVPFDISSYVPDKVCSFTPSTKCDSKRKIGSFNQVELYDGTLLVVPELHIAIKEYLDDEDFICFDSQGLRQHPKPPYTGTSYFCNKKECNDNAPLFCTFGTSTAIFTTSTGYFIVKAWGVTTKEYFGHLAPVTSEMKISAICLKGGAQITSTVPMNALEACIANYCLFITNSTNSPAMFPTALIAFDYEVHISAWSKGKLVHRQQLFCQAQAICEMIQCTVCWESIYNLHCWTKIQLVIAGFIAIIAFIGLTLLSPLLHSLAVLVDIIFRMCRFAIRRLRPCSTRQKRPSGFRQYTGHRRKLLIAIIIFGLQSTTPCSDFISFTASEEMCVSSETNQTCTYNQATIMTLQPLDQETCLILKDNNDKSVGLLTIRIKDIYYTCQKRTEFYTRDHQFYSESVHRCRFAGSCRMDTCDNTKTTDRIEEFSRTANDHPGFTFCAASCGCLTCGGCFLCMSSCLFYRYYAYPESQVVYEVFNCPTWELAVEIQVTIQNQAMENEVTTLKLHPGRTVRWNHILMSLIGTTVPQLPILSSTFITDGMTTGITKKVSSGHLIPHTVGQLQCFDKHAATIFNCSFPSNVCTCTTAVNRATCTCSSPNLAENIKKAPLPVTTKNVMIYQEGKSLKAKMGVGTIMQVHLVAEGLKVTTTKPRILWFSSTFVNREFVVLVHLREPRILWFSSTFVPSFVAKKLFSLVI